jgi:hypothetical protein
MSGHDLLQGAERAKSLASAIVAIARNLGRKRLGEKFNHADLRDLVIQCCPAEDKYFWEGPYCSPASITGLLRYEGFDRYEMTWSGKPDPDKREVGEIRKLVERERVDFWEREEDQLWRIVDTTLKPQMDWTGGQRCRFCGITEQASGQLEHIELRAFKALVTGLVHPRCRPYLVAWHSDLAEAVQPKLVKAAGK